MTRKAYAPFLAAAMISLVTFAPTAQAHTAQQAFETLEMISGEKPDLSVPQVQNLSILVGWNTQSLVLPALLAPAEK
ncbi:hypothetical protein [Cognatishimia activa]|uniref:hypothetical protein n=1 Tax=Cognatishimia activa TaxID=1715691 RepID=UPI00222F7ADC|nr:hypothetical protein [Cognatishimia activa]UZD90805.1 hypothetical protein M0D42_14630 [Cognatishimia activa]